jgi:hypothetical protein
MREHDQADRALGHSSYAAKHHGARVHRDVLHEIMTAEHAVRTLQLVCLCGALGLLVEQLADARDQAASPYDVL